MIDKNRRDELIGGANRKQVERKSVMPNKQSFDDVVFGDGVVEETSAWRRILKWVVAVLVIAGVGTGVYAVYRYVDFSKFLPHEKQTVVQNEQKDKIIAPSKEVVQLYKDNPLITAIAAKPEANNAIDVKVKGDSRLELSNGYVIDFGGEKISLPNNTRVVQSGDFAYTGKIGDANIYYVKYPVRNVLFNNSTGFTKLQNKGFVLSSMFVTDFGGNSVNMFVGVAPDMSGVMIVGENKSDIENTVKNVSLLKSLV